MGRTISGHGPMVDILAKAKALTQGEPDILDISIQAGFDWSDKKHLGSSVLVTGEDGTPRAQALADELARFIWETRGVKTIELLPIDEAMRIAKEPAEYAGSAPDRRLHRLPRRCSHGGRHDPSTGHDRG